MASSSSVSQSLDKILTAKVRATLTVRLLISSRIFFPGSHPVRGVQVMKVGKLQLHQGMFPQAMKNLRLVSVPRLGFGPVYLSLALARPLLGDCEALLLACEHTHAQVCW